MSEWLCSYHNTKIRTRRKIQALAIAFMLVTGLLATGSPVAAASANSASLGWTNTGNIRWMVSRSAIDLIDGKTGNGALTTAAFDNVRTNEMGTPKSGWSSLPTTTYTSFKAFSSAINTIPAGSWVIYDNEHWPQTPHHEQWRAGQFMRQFVSEAHGHHLHVILTPALDLVEGMDCGTNTDPTWRKYLDDCRVPALAAAAHPDAVEIQAQELQDDTNVSATNCGCYAWFVRQAAAQARAVPRESTLRVYAGLSTNHAGTVSTGLDLDLDSLHTRRFVAGYWLNVPKRSTSCPSCVSNGAPGIAVNYLHRLGYQP